MCSLVFPSKSVEVRTFQAGAVTEQQQPLRHAQLIPSARDYARGLKIDTVFLICFLYFLLRRVIFRTPYTALFGENEYLSPPLFDGMLCVLIHDTCTCCILHKYVHDKFIIKRFCTMLFKRYALLHTLHMKTDISHSLLRYYKLYSIRTVQRFRVIQVH